MLPLSMRIAVRHLRAKKRRTISAITMIAISGVALGVAAFLSVLSITSGFQDEFRNKVLGVNAHVLILKYGLDFSEYPDVIAKAKRNKETRAASPFLLHEMMLIKGGKLSGVLVKGIDPNQSLGVLDVGKQIISGSLAGLKAPDAQDVPPPAEPQTQRQATAERASDKPGLVVSKKHAEALTEHNAKDLAPLPDDDVEGAILAQLHDAEHRDGQPPGILVGATLAKNLGLKVNDRVQLVSPLASTDGSFWPENTAPKSRDFTIVGIFEAGFQEYDTRLVYVDLREAQAFLGQGDTVTGVEIKLHDYRKAPEVSRRLLRQLDALGSYHTLDWRELNHNLFTALELQKLMLGLVIATIIIVAAFNVIATLIMLVMEKRKEIAILKAMGAGNRSILAIFFIQGTVIGLIGTAIGLALGGAVCGYLSRIRIPLDAKVYLIDHLPVRIGSMEFVIAAVAAVLICMTATLIPSAWAARMLPASGLRPQ